MEKKLYENIAEDFSPDPLALLESNRNLGYSIEEAVADLIDNSITADATKIVINLDWNNGDPIFKLCDNGSGMGEEKLIESFRLGSLERRNPKDLGRFGFGMKTASLSQARELIVLSKTKRGKVVIRSLDLNFIENNNKKWNLKYCDLIDYKNEIDELNKTKQGTIICWKNWDRAPKFKDDFISLISQISNYAAVCFHRFLEKGIKIFSHDELIIPVNPIPKDSQKYSEIPLRKHPNSKQIAYILKHPKFWEQEYDFMPQINSYKLFNGFASQQGIYIYRCERLLNPYGGWLGVTKSINSSKLARVTIDYPNSADNLWSLDITKTNATIPYQFKKEIEKLIENTKLESVSKLTRGVKSIKNKVSAIYDSSLIWDEKEDKDLRCYRYFPNINHPIFLNFIERKKIDKNTLTSIFNLLSENLPVAKIIENNDNDSGKHDRMIRKEKLTKDELELAKNIYERIKIDKNKAEALNFLFKCEPFCYHEKQVKQFIQ
jgi:Histidine kinase-, DNA gyrase B-, and HSP90-like ATPase